ncbi:MAG: carbamoyltransferase HypF [Elusimicrobiota bacterium]
MKRYKITVSGRVQGVGFRPTIYRYALSEKLAGFVSNTAEGVIIEVEGSEKNIKNFLRKLKSQSPRQSKIAKISVKKIPFCMMRSPEADKKFSIKKSTLFGNGKTALHISPDISICDDCLKELFDKKDRRYLYPFVNCTNCGPRFTIIKDIPYDRKKTTMKEFKMCKNCQKEYENPLDRRFHAQPNACWDCGPSVELVGSLKFEVGSGGRYCSADVRCGKMKVGSRGKKAIEKTIKLLKQGKIIAIKGIGGFHICCDATNDEAVKKLRRRKNRLDKPFAVMMPDIKTVKKFCYVNKIEKEVLISAEKPVVLLKNLPSSSPQANLLGIFHLPSFVAPNNNSLGVMLPYTPIHYLLFQQLTTYNLQLTTLVMTSGNKQDEPICKDNDEAIKELSGICDYFLVHDREIFNRCDDSIVEARSQKSEARSQKSPLFCPSGTKQVGGDRQEARVIRRSRGYAPNPIFLFPIPYPLHTILSTGAELKNTFCLTRRDEAYPSQYIGDLKDAKSYEFYKEAIEKMKNLLKVEPKIIAHDLHPDYLSTHYAKELRTMNSFTTGSPRCEAGEPARELRTFAVQHHHAHIASVCAEYKIEEKIIGVAFDGTGYGTDGNIWGGEFLIVNGGGTFERKVHLKYIELPGGDSATNEIWRIGFSYLYSIFGEDVVRYFQTRRGGFGANPPRRISVIKKMIEKNVNCPLTSSVGRLFDAVASIINLRQETTYEAQSAVELEQLIDGRWKKQEARSKKQERSYEYEVIGDEIDVKKMILEIVNDLKNKTSKNKISAKFHSTLAKIILDVCQRLKKETKINKVALSGGVFQNLVLLEKAVGLLKKAGFEVFTNSQVPSNDGGISLGQAWIAQKLLTKER